MARQALAVTEIGSDGTTLPAATAGHADGLSCTNDGRTIIEIENTGAGAHTVTFQTPADVAGYEVEEHTVSVAAGATEYVSRLNTNIFNRPVGGVDPGLIYIDCDASPAELQFRAIRG